MIKFKNTNILMNRFIDIETIDKVIEGRDGRKMTRSKATDDGKKNVAMYLAYPWFDGKTFEMRGKDKSTKNFHLIVGRAVSEGIERFHKREGSVNIKSNHLW